MRRSLLTLAIAASLVLVSSGCNDDTKADPPTDQGTTPTTPAVSDADIAKAVAAITDTQAGEPKFISDEQARCVATEALPKLSDTGKGYLTDGIKHEGEDSSPDAGSSGGSGKSTTTTTDKKSKDNSGADTAFADLEEADRATVVAAFNTCLPLGDLLKAVIGSALPGVDLGQQEIDCAEDKVKPDYDGSGDLFKAMVSSDREPMVKVFRVGFKCMDETNQRSTLEELFAALATDPSVGNCLADLAVTDGSAADLFASLIAGEQDEFTTFLTDNGAECGFDTSGDGTGIDPAGDDPVTSTPASASDGSGVGSGIGGY